jgi:hypothetical protein
LRPLINFVTNPLFSIAVIYLLSFLLLQKFGKRLGSSEELVEYRLAIEAIFFIFGLDFWLFNIPFGWDDIPPFLVFLAIVAVTSKLDIWKKPKAFVFGCLSSIFISSVLVLLLQPIYKKDFSLYLVLPNLTVSGWAYETILFSLMFFLSGFLWMSYSDFLLSIFRKPKKTSFALPQLIIAHIQLIPLFLFPLFVVQVVGRSELLEPIVINLFNLSISLLYLLPYCVILSLIGEKILKLRFLWITSIFSLISFSNAIYVAFQFIALNLDLGAFALGVIISSLLCYSIGIIFGRYLNHPESTVLNKFLREALHKKSTS